MKYFCRYNDNGQATWYRSYTRDLETPVTVEGEERTVEVVEEEIVDVDIDLASYLGALYEEHNQEVWEKEGIDKDTNPDSIKLICVNLTFNGEPEVGQGVRGIANYRVDGQHKQYRFNIK